MTLHSNTLLKVIVIISVCDLLIAEESLNILGVFPVPAKSHFYVFEPYLKELAKRGHNITVISYFPQKEPLRNYSDINLAADYGSPKLFHPIIDSIIITLITLTVVHSVGGSVCCRLVLENEDVQNLIVTDAKFDLVVVEQFNSDCGLALAHKFGAPVIGITSHMLLPWHYQRFGVPYNPSYALFDFIKAGTKPTLFERVQRLLFYNYINFVNYYITQRLEHNVISEYLDDIPPLEELGRNVKMVLVYQNFILSGTSILPNNVIEVGGLHVSKPKPLPDDLRKFIEGAEHGVIYISFGSILNPSTMAKDKLLFIIEAMEELEQKVIWKWNKKNLPGNPKNILVTKWLPQNDVLAHPNVVAFFSHCGQLGTTEAIYNGVPVVGMPIFGDQPANAAAIEESGLGVQINLNDLTKDRLLEKFKKVLNPSFRKKVKILSKAWHDRPMKAMDTAIFWTEFTAKHNITYRAPNTNVPLYQYFCLDVLAVLLLIMIMNILLLKYLLTMVVPIFYKYLKLKISQRFSKYGKSHLKSK